MEVRKKDDILRYGEQSDTGLPNMFAKHGRVKAVRVQFPGIPPLYRRCI